MDHGYREATLFFNIITYSHNISVCMCVCACVCHPSTQFMCDVYYIIPFGLQTQPT